MPSYTQALNNCLQQISLSWLCEYLSKCAHLEMKNCTLWTHAAFPLFSSAAVVTFVKQILRKRAFTSYGNEYESTLWGTFMTWVISVYHSHGQMKEFVFTNSKCIAKWTICVQIYINAMWEYVFQRSWRLWLNVNILQNEWKTFQLDIISHQKFYFSNIRNQSWIRPILSLEGGWLIVRAC